MLEMQAQTTEDSAIARKQIQSRLQESHPPNSLESTLAYDSKQYFSQPEAYSSHSMRMNNHINGRTFLPPSPQNAHQEQSLPQFNPNGNRHNNSPVPNGGTGEHKIVVGIDFGTTYSAIAWGDSTSTNIELIDSWPSTGQRVHHSAPTEIHYPEGDTTNYNWGYDIPPNAKRLKWFKLLLEATNEEIRSNIDLPPNMTIMDVVIDFMKALYNHTIETLYRKKGRQLMDLTKVDFILTVPAVWTEGAKQRTQKCAEAAGFTNGHNLSMTTEPEAAALYYIRSQDNLSIQVSYYPHILAFYFTSNMIKVNDRVVVCDCGGGTVDLISYLVLEIMPVLRVREIAVGEGDFWGSTVIDRNFEMLFKKRMGEHYLKLRPETRQRVVKNFEEIKCAFRDRPDQKSYHVSVPTVDTIPEAGVHYGEFELSQQDMRDLFDPIINAILELLRKQIALGSRESPVNSILLVGGFGESIYLFNKVQEWAGPMGIMVLQPRGAATSIVKGAVLRGLELVNQLPIAQSRVERLARKNYGTASNQEFIPGKHLEKDAWTDTKTGKKMAMNQISWFIMKGQPLSDDTKISNHFHRNFRKCSPWIDKLLVSSAEQPPSRIEGDVRMLCKMTSDLTKLSKKEFNSKWRRWRRYYEAQYRLDMSIESAEVKFELIYKNKSYGFAKAEFE